MSEAKFDAVRELISQQRYDEARILLRTIDHPEAQAWLNELDAMHPPPYSPEIYSEEERSHSHRAGNVTDGIFLIASAGLCFFAFALFAFSRDVSTGFAWFFIPVGIGALIAGIYQIIRH